MINETPFIRQNLEDDKRYQRFTVRLNEEEQRWLAEDMKILRQPKDSTALKQLALIGHIVIHDDKMGQILRLILENRRRNDRLGIPDEEGSL